MVIGGLGTDAHDPDHVAALRRQHRVRRHLHLAPDAGGARQARLVATAPRPASASTASATPSPCGPRPRPPTRPRCLALQLELLHAFREDGVTDDELDFVKRYLVRSHAFDIDTARKRVHQKLEAELYALPPGYHDRYVEHVQAVDRAAANAAVRARLSEDDLVIGVVGTHAEIGEAIAKAIPRLASVTVAPVRSGVRPPRVTGDTSSSR